MAGPENQSAKKTAESPPPANDGPGHDWKLKAVDTDSFSHSGSGVSSNFNSSANFASGSNFESDILNTSTHFGSPFQRVIELESGAIIGGSYRIVRLIGKGGMGQVYLVEHITLGKKCALKVMSSNQVTEKAWIRFQTEAKAIAGLDHPNLVRVNDLGIHENALPFFAMEYVDGQSLAQRLAERGPMDLNITLEVLLQICNGIECAHKQGIVHRDIKPANIMLVEDSQKPEQFQIKILDFGLAKLSQREAAEINLTATGEIFGSPLYMSPEQCAGESTDLRSDIYSLGCTVFECLTGQPPFTGEMAIPIMNRKIFGEAPTLGSAAAKKVFPPNLELIIAKMLKKDPKDRYQTIADLKADLPSAMSGEPLCKNSGSGHRQSATPAERLIRHKDGAGASVPSLPPRNKRPRNLAACAIIGGVISLAVIFFVKVAESSAPIATIAPNGIAPIADFLSPHDWLVRIQSANAEQLAANRQPGIRFSSSEFIERSRRTHSIVADAEAHLTAMGERAIPACIQDLGEQTSSSPVAGQVLVANGITGLDPMTGLLKQKPALASTIVPLLQKMGPTVGDSLCTQATLSLNQSDKAFAIKTLAQLANNDSLHMFIMPGHKPTLPILSEANRTNLLSLLKREFSADLRTALIDALAYFKSPTPDAVSDLSQILREDRSEIVQQAAAKTLGCMLGGSSQYGSVDIVKALSSALYYPHEPEATKVACLDALAKASGSVQPATVTAIRTASRDSSETVRQKALQALASLAAQNHSCLPDLIVALEEPNQTTVNCAVAAVTKMGPEAKPALPALIKLTASTQRNEGGRVIGAICAIGVENSPEGMAVLLKALDLPPTIEHWHELRSVITTFERMGPSAKQAIPGLQRLAKATHFPFSHDAERALQSIDR